jgi:hypothetical protein
MALNQCNSTVPYMNKSHFPALPRNTIHVHRRYLIKTTWIIFYQLNSIFYVTRSLFNVPYTIHCYTCDQLNIVCNGTTIASTKSVKYLGADLDKCLSGESIANQVIKKANAELKFLFRKRSFLNRYTKKLLVSSLI